MTAYVLTHPGKLSEEATFHLGRELREWDGKSPVVLQEGARLSVIGGLTFTVRLLAGPLHELRFTINVASLRDIPPYFDAEGGRYTNQGMRTTDGDPSYSWRPD